MILTIGDFVTDEYLFGRATRICPEAPVPVVVPEYKRISNGGVGLVANQLRALGVEVVEWRGSMSHKLRTFAGNQLVCRVDTDSLNYEPQPFPDEALRECEAVIVSDYGKGGMFPEIADELKRAGKWLFVDAKHHWHWYKTPYSYFFPNEHEIQDAEEASDRQVQLIQKLGARGCKWGEIDLPATVSEVVDVCGAGDVFIAAFTYATICERLIPSDCLRFANALAGESCRHRGTYFVGHQFAQAVLDSLRPSEESAQRDPDLENYSIEGDIAATPHLQRVVSEIASQAFRNPDVDSVEVQGGAINSLDTVPLWRIRRKLPSDPTDTSDAQLQPETDWSEHAILHKGHTDQNPIGSEYPHGHKSEPDQG